MNASVIDVYLDSADWELDPYRTELGHQSGNGVISSSLAGLQVTDTLTHPGSPYGTYVRTVGSYDVQDTTIRYKWKAINSPSYANFWNGHDFWTFGASMTTGWSWAGSTVIPNDTWIYAQAYVGADLSWYYNFSYTGYSDQGGFRSASGVATNLTWFDSLSSVHLTASVNDNRNPGAGFVISEMSLTTPSAPGGQIPEPATIVLMGLGLVGLGLRQKVLAKK